ncbi:hypothetical protein [Schleiferilactobacillus perolens]|uniref:hypothetical protein n=1 Tax=Schleiferilactobacillus perolens TaxID=100468 RepID=UPI00070F7279|nr:hypothetical protein [Schleiferilactobacillus perolens]
MATKSFHTDFRFTAKSANALVDALNRSQRVDTEIKQPRYMTNEVEKLNKFETLFEFNEVGYTEDV